MIFMRDMTYNTIVLLLSVPQKDYQMKGTEFLDKTSGEKIMFF